MTVIRGLEGVVATTSSVSSIIDDTLTYVGYNIDDLAENATFEEVVYLLWHRKLPNEKELAEFNEIVSEYYKVPGEILTYLKQVDLKLHIRCLFYELQFPCYHYTMRALKVWMKSPII